MKNGTLLNVLGENWVLVIDVPFYNIKNLYLLSTPEWKTFALKNALGKNQSTEKLKEYGILMFPFNERKSYKGVLLCDCIIDNILQEPAREKKKEGIFGYLHEYGANFLSEMLQVYAQTYLHDFSEIFELDQSLIDDITMFLANILEKLRLNPQLYSRKILKKIIELESTKNNIKFNYEHFVQNGNRYIKFSNSLLDVEPLMCILGYRYVEKKFDFRPYAKQIKPYYYWTKNPDNKCLSNPLTLITNSVYHKAFGTSFFYLTVVFNDEYLFFGLDSDEMSSNTLFYTFGGKVYSRFFIFAESGKYDQTCLRFDSVPSDFKVYEITCASFDQGNDFYSINLDKNNKFQWTKNQFERAYNAGHQMINPVEEIELEHVPSENIEESILERSVIEKKEEINEPSISERLELKKKIDALLVEKSQTEAAMKSYIKQVEVQLGNISAHKEKILINELELASKPKAELIRLNLDLDLIKKDNEKEIKKLKKIEDDLRSTVKKRKDRSVKFIRDIEKEIESLSK